MKIIEYSTIGLIAAAALANSTYAATISAETVFYFGDSSGPNSSGFSVNNLNLALIVDGVEPDGKSGTTVTAEQGATEVELGFNPLTQQPKNFGTGVDASLNGSWTITLSNEDDTLILSTPEIGEISSDTQPAISAVKVEGGSPTSPIVSWETPEGIDDVQIVIMDLQSRNSGGVADALVTYSVGVDQNTFQIPDGVMEEGSLYSIQLISVENYSPEDIQGFDVPIAPQKSIRSTFFDYAATSVPVPESYYLPQVDLSGETPVFNFDNPVLDKTIEYYDPIIAVGYDFITGGGYPNFNSFILPSLGDDLFELFLFNGTDYDLFGEVLAGEEFVFDVGGVDRFRILGIEIAEMLDPEDPTAFVTGLSFVSEGRFTGTMTPIVSAVPLPAGALLLLTGLIGLFGVRLKRIAFSPSPA